MNAIITKASLVDLLMNLASQPANTFQALTILLSRDISDSFDDIPISRARTRSIWTYGMPLFNYENHSNVWSTKILFTLGIC